MEHSDEQLVTEYLRGDEAAFGELVRRNLGPTFRFVLRYVDADEAEDVVQEAFVKAWKNIRAFREGRRFSPWLLQIAKNAALDHLKKKRATSFSEIAGGEDALAGAFAGRGAALSDLLDARRRDRALALAVAALPETQKKAVSMRYGEDMTFRKIAEILGRSVDTVKSWHWRALRALRGRIRRDEAGEE